MRRRLLLLVVLACAGLSALCPVGCTPESSSGGTEEAPGRVHEGDYAVSNRADLAKLADVARITGKLTIKRAEVSTVALPRLEEVGGKLAIQKNKRLSAVELPGLRRVGSARGDDLILEHNPLLERVELGALKTSHGIKVRRNDKLRQVVLTGLERDLGNGLDFESNHELTQLQLGALRATQRLAVGSSTKLGSLDLSALEQVSAITLSANPVLTQLDVVDQLGEERAKPAPRSVGAREIRIEHNRALRTCEAQRLIERMRERGWRGESHVCGSAADTCGSTACP